MFDNDKSWDSGVDGLMIIEGLHLSWIAPALDVLLLHKRPRPIGSSAIPAYTCMMELPTYGHFIMFTGCLTDLIKCVTRS